MKFSAYILIIFFLITHFNFAQNDSKINFWDHVQFGGGLNLGFGNDITNIGISPSAIYNFSDQFSAGLGVSYLYAKNNNFNEALNIYGTSLLSLFNPLEEIQLSAEYEKLFINQSNFSSRDTDALYLGIGYLVGKNISLGLRYDVLYNENESVFGSAFSPIARIYF